MDPPEDVAGFDCAMCHGDFATQYEYPHFPAYNGECTICHLEAGEEGHGGLVIDGRELCLACHGDKDKHFTPVSCYFAGCHADKHGSDVNELYNPSLAEEFPISLEGMPRPDDVSGVDCAMCHGSFAEDLAYPHYPAASGECVFCHLEAGEEGHGGLVAKDRDLCLACHADKEEHMSPMSCYTAGCHAEVHGSDTSELFGLGQLGGGLEGVERPMDVTGADCAMCHGDIGQDFKHPHEPAFTGDCVSCHLTTGPQGHGDLVSENRDLCLGCHGDQENHYSLLTCWTASCHADTHGSDLDPLLNPSRAEAYPGFFESTQCADYVGSDTCLACHWEPCEQWSQSMHSLADQDCDIPADRRGCESCHGPGGNHWGRWAGIGDFDMAYAEEADTVCLKCHKDELYVPDYTRSTHYKSSVACISCHDVHDQTEKHNLRDSPNEVCFSCHKTTRADFVKLSHHPVDDADPRSGLLCIDCHSPHGSTERMMFKTSRDQLCFECHVDKEGPFVYSHAGYDPALGRGCFTCHSAHGSNSPDLLNMTGQAVCMQCHSDVSTHAPHNTCWAAGCHSEHHGSNESYFFFDW